MAPLKEKKDSGLIIAPHISEKASLLAEVREGGRPQYIFRVAPHATKILLKRAVKDRYDVKVYAVRILRTEDKMRRRGATVGRRPGFKKAIVTLVAGQKISEF